MTDDPTKTADDPERLWDAKDVPTHDEGLLELVHQLQADHDCPIAAIVLVVGVRPNGDGVALGTTMGAILTPLKDTAADLAKSMRDDVFRTAHAALTSMLAQHHIEPLDAANIVPRTLPPRH